MRIFDDADITHVDGDVDPVRDIEVVNLELVLSDLQTVSKRLRSVQSEVKGGDKEAVIEKGALTKIEKVLTAGKLASETALTDDERYAVKGLQLLTMKPIMYVLNKKEGGLNLDEMKDERYQKLIAFLENLGATYVTVDAGIEGELRDVSDDEKQSLRQEFGVLDDGIDNLIRAGYELLGLITFLTTGPDETRAWTITEGSSAPEAGAAIHSDFRDQFIRAEVVSYENLSTLGSYTKARDKGLVRTEGKEYIVRDGDVIEFKI